VAQLDIFLSMNPGYWLDTYGKDFHNIFLGQMRVIMWGKKSDDPLRWDNSVSTVVGYGADYCS
jgi:hypothetical protein